MFTNPRDQVYQVLSHAPLLLSAVGGLYYFYYIYLIEFNIFDLAISFYFGLSNPFNFFIDLSELIATINFVHFFFASLNKDMWPGCK